uniref:C-type lectin domain-containing protein n=1 Tax=Oncorhynchus tshawytscha TaxID=74940 RepID=A0AAZ3PSP9_ONCTS
WTHFCYFFQKQGQLWLFLPSPCLPHQYHFVNMAQSYCREYHTDLASVRNQTENQEIQKMVSKGSKVWIGLFRDSWKWSDGSDSSFRYWRHAQPNNNGGVQSCGAAVHKGEKSWTERWFDWNCEDRYPFVCYSGELL